MKAAFTAVLLAAALVFLAACAHHEAAKEAGRQGARRFNTVYIWDADGHTDLSLLRGLKSEAASYLRSRGVSVPENPEAVEAYLKMTVLEAERGEDSGRSFIKARLYILDASGGGMVYDRTAEVKGRDGYPVRGFVEEALGGYYK